MSKKTINRKTELLESLKREIGKCEKCGETDRLTIDHVVPKQILEAFGLTEYEIMERELVQLYCQRCNNFKGDRLDISNPRTKEILDRLFDMVGKLKELK